MKENTLIKRWMSACAGALLAVLALAACEQRQPIEDQTPDQPPQEPDQRPLSPPA